MQENRPLLHRKHILSSISFASYDKDTKYIIDSDSFMQLLGMCLSNILLKSAYKPRPGHQAPRTEMFLPKCKPCLRVVLYSRRIYIAAGTPASATCFGAMAA